MFEVSGRHAFVTGASSGIGRHVALILAAHGAKVSLGARRVDKIEAVVKEISASDGQACAVPLDVADSGSVAAAVATAVKTFGPVEILINNAGVVGDRPILDISETDWDRILDTNLKGAWLCAQAVARGMIDAACQGTIINIASVLGIVTQKGTGPYSASKAGLIHLTKAMAAEWARYGIRVNALAPGYIATDMVDEFLSSERGQKFIKQIPQRRAGTLDDLTGPMLLLASDASRYMTGSVLTVDGGAALGSY